MVYLLESKVVLHGAPKLLNLLVIPLPRAPLVAMPDLLPPVPAGLWQPLQQVPDVCPLGALCFHHHHQLFVLISTPLPLQHILQLSAHKHPLH